MSAVPSRSATTATRSSALSEEVITDEDTSEVTKLFTERLQAWKHACGYLEDYIQAQEKLHHSISKDYDKVSKTVSHPLKEGHHFDQQVGGVAGLFESLRSNTTGVANSHAETAKVLKGTILPIFERLHSEVKSKTKELTKGAGKSSKVVDKARSATQTHIEKLGQHSAGFASVGGKVTAAEDPYVLARQVRHKLNKQIVEENNARQDMISVQNNFAQFESHIMAVIQDGLGQFNIVVGKQLDQEKIMYGDLTKTAQQVPGDFEWNGFVQRNMGILIDPQAPPQSMATATFPNQDHPATQALIAGSLERKSKLLRKFNNAYYVITPSKYMHEFETDDDFAKEPSPEISLFLPDCQVGALDGLKFDVKGKDVSKGKLGISMSTTHDYHFQAKTASDAQQWHHIIKSAAGQVTADLPVDSTPSSPVAAASPQATSLDAALEKGEPSSVQTQGVTGAQDVASPVEATPMSATAPAHGAVPAASSATSAAPATVVEKS